MFDALATLLPASFVALDLACEPGSISQRLLTRFRGARAITLGIDPVMLAIGQGAIGTIDGRLRWPRPSHPARQQPAPHPARPQNA